MKKYPEATIYFREQLKIKAANGIYHTNINSAGNTIPINVFPGVFPPQQKFQLGEYLKNYPDIQNIEVADIGTGSGIEAISAALLGAMHVDAIDISPLALECAKQNARINNVTEKLSLFLSDLFFNIPDYKKYGLILANLPFVDFDGENNSIDLALYDNNFNTHKKFLAQSERHLADNGRILLPHANLQSGKTESPNADFDVLETIILDAGYKLRILDEKPFRAEYRWRLYELRSN
ncbi:MAG: 50S ribosomal protein L11 methyltransferase [Candidatus Moraniibacteriota bacterium]